MPNELPVILHKNGTATLEIGDQRITLRMPKVGEFEQLRLAQHALGEQIIDVADEAAARSREIDTEIAGLGGIDLTIPEDQRVVIDELALPLEARTRIKELRREQRTLQGGMATATRDLRLAWVRDAIEKLRIKPGDLPDDDELPQYLTTLGFTTALVGHWQTTPLARGGG